MKSFALLVALFLMLVATVGIVAPDRIITVGHYVITPMGLYVVAALRILMGLVLMLVASASRLPKTIRVIGIIVLVAGIGTPFFGVERTRQFADWAAAQGPMFIRSAAACLLAFGAFIAYALGSGRRPA